MRKMREFRCTDCRKLTEQLVKDEVTTVRCKCGASAKRVISAVRCILDPISGHFPGATDKWARHHEKMAQQPSE